MDQLNEATISTRPAHTTTLLIIFVSVTVTVSFFSIQQMPHVKLANGDSLPMIGMGTFTGTRHTAKAQAGTLYETTKV